MLHLPVLKFCVNKEEEEERNDTGSFLVGFPYLYI
jgi:hypothetical protein